MKDITIYIGYDSANYGQQLAHDVCKKSIQKYNPDIKIIHKMFGGNYSALPSLRGSASNNS